jgi:hypothetical protein
MNTKTHTKEMNHNSPTQGKKAEKRTARVSLPSDLSELVPQLAKAVALELAGGRRVEGIPLETPLNAGFYPYQFAYLPYPPMMSGYLRSPYPNITPPVLNPYQMMDPTQFNTTEGYLGKRAEQTADIELDFKPDFLKDPDFIMGLYHLKGKSKGFAKIQNEQTSFNKFSYDLTSQVAKSKELRQFLNSLYGGFDQSSNQVGETNRNSYAAEESFGTNFLGGNVDPTECINDPQSKKVSFQNLFGSMLDAIKGVRQIPEDHRTVEAISRGGMSRQIQTSHYMPGDSRSWSQKLPELPKFMEANLPTGSVLSSVQQTFQK